jgi:FHS family Na+ dependent glucose MFS transporter 1
MDSKRQSTASAAPDAPANQNRRASTLGYFGATIVFGLISAALGPTLPNLAENVRTGLSQISLIFTAQASGYLVGSLLSGRLFDRLPGNRLMSGILFCLAGVVFFIPVVDQFWLLIFIFTLVGILLGGMEVGSNTLLVWVHGVRVGPYMNALHFFFGLGAIISPILVARLALESGSIQAVYWLLALSAVPVAIWLGRLVGPRANIKSIFNQIDPGDYYLIFMVALLLFLYVGAEVGYGGWIYTYTISLFGEEMAVAATMLTSAFWGALTLGRLVSIPMAVRIKPKTVLLGDLIGCLLSIGLIALFPGSIPVVWLGTLGLGFFMAAFFPTTITYAGQRMQINGKVSGWFFVGAGAGGMVIPWLIGQLFESIGPQITITLILIDLLAALMVLVILLANPQRAAGKIVSVPEGD